MWVCIPCVHIGFVHRVLYRRHRTPQSFWQHVFLFSLIGLDAQLANEYEWYGMKVYINRYIHYNHMSLDIVGIYFSRMLYVRLFYDCYSFCIQTSIGLVLTIGWYLYIVPMIPKWSFDKKRRTPSHHPLIDRFSIIKTIHFLGGYPMTMEPYSITP